MWEFDIAVSEENDLIEWTFKPTDNIVILSCKDL